MSHYPADKIDKNVVLHHAVTLPYQIETCHEGAERPNLLDKVGIWSIDNVHVHIAYQSCFLQQLICFEERNYLAQRARGVRLRALPHR